MIKRYMGFFNLKGLFAVLAFFYAVILTSDAVKSAETAVFFIVVLTFAVLLSNGGALSNIKWVVTGRVEDMSDSHLPESYKALKDARLGKDRPLFVAAEGRYWYYDEGYGKR